MRRQELSNFFDSAGMELDEMNPAAPQSMANFDEDAYRSYLNGIEMEDEQKRELLRILWDMMRCFVEWNIPAESWGQIVEAFTEAAAANSSDVESKNI